MKDYYKLLGIENNADLQTIKKAFRALVIKLHPDKNPLPEAAKQFIEVTEAYEVLKDPENRKEYDMFCYHNFVKKEKHYAYSTHKQAWQEHGKQKAKEYSSMSFDDFMKRFMDEVKIGTRYGINFFLIALCVFAVISTPTFFSVSPFLGLFSLLLYGGLGYRLFNRTRKDYQQDRKQKFNH